jgi:RNA polymerase sigma factor (TIGR02999 family)
MKAGGAAMEDSTSWAMLVECAYPELRRLARALLHRERPNHTLQPTALVNAALARMLRIDDLTIRDQRHFIRLAALKMRQLLVDHARARLRTKRQGEIEQPWNGREANLEAIVLAGQLLDALAEIDERAAQVMDLNYFGGFTEEEIAVLLEISPATAHRDRIFAHAWMRRLAAKRRAAAA